MSKIPEKVKLAAHARYLRREAPESIGPALGISVRIIYYWRDREGWDKDKERAWSDARERQVKDATKEIAEEHKRIAGLVRLGFRRLYDNMCVDDPSKSKFQPSTTRELHDLIKAWALLHGEPTEIIGTSGPQRQLSPFERFLDGAGDTYLRGLGLADADNTSEPEPPPGYEEVSDEDDVPDFGGNGHPRDDNGKGVDGA